LSTIEQQPPPPDDALVVTRTVIDEPVSYRSRIIGGSIILVTGAISIIAWGLGAKSHSAAFSFSQLGDNVTVPTLHINGRIAAIVLGALIIAAGGWHLARGFSRRQLTWVRIGVIVAFVLAFLCWVGTGTQSGGAINLQGLLQQTVLLSIPLILGALAGIVGERSGVINVAIEGQLLVGAFAGALFGSLASNLGVGVIAAMLAGGLLGGLLAVFAIRYQVNQVVLGVVLNVFALGLTGYLYKSLQATNQSLNKADHLNPIKIPLLGDIPIIGRALFDDNIIVYLTYVLIIGVDIALFRTRWGLRTRAVGEHPKAADTVGIKVLRTRYRNVMIGGLIAGLGGAYLTVGNVGTFSEGMSNGKGFIALAAVIFGKWSPRGAVGAALLFAFSDALQTVLSIVGSPVSIPSNILLMLPYLVTIFAVAGLVGRTQAPAADGEPYVK
jgi:general nucleoside transport system permease protein